MGMSAIDISASGMRAQRLRMEIIANNLANVETTSALKMTEVDGQGKSYVEHTPYRRKEVVFQIGGVNEKDKNFGVSVPMIVDDESDFRYEFNPGHRHAVKNPDNPDFGRVRLPNVDPMVEMVDMIAASRAYEANITAVETAKSMGSATMRILA